MKKHNVMTKQEITDALEKIQKQLDGMRGEDVDFMFLSNDRNRGIVNGSPLGIAALLIWNMSRYPVFREIVEKAIGFYYSKKQEIDKRVKHDDPVEEIIDMK